MRDLATIARENREQAGPVVKVRPCRGRVTTWRATCADREHPPSPAYGTKLEAITAAGRHLQVDHFGRGRVDGG